MRSLIKAIRCILPTSCIVCGQVSARDYSICSDCEQELPRLDACCLRCGIPMNGRASRDSSCPKCQLSPPAFDACNAAFPYESPIDSLVADFKFSARFDIGYSLSRILAEAFNNHYADRSKPELLLPVPLHNSRLRSRGFNQANEICRVLSRRCRVPSSPRALIKTRKTEPQTSMSSAAARKSNLREAFALSGSGLFDAVTHIAIVDDVVTTMATVESISRLLRERLDCRIDVWCLARASRESSSQH